jgi:hypothetical protein
MNINETQAWILDYAIPEAGMTKDEFCALARIKTVADLQQSRYQKALAYLEEKIREQYASPTKTSTT